MARSKTQYDYIPGFEERYSISDQGVVWSHISLREIRHNIVSGEYHAAMLYRNPGDQGEKHYVSRLVLKVYVGDPPELWYDACYKDDNKDNNELNNLEWGTRQYNVEQACAGEKHHKSKFKNGDILDIRRRYKEGASISLLSTDYKVGWSTIDCIVKRQTWEHIPEEKVYG